MQSLAECFLLKLCDPSVYSRYPSLSPPPRPLPARPVVYKKSNRNISSFANHDTVPLLFLVRQGSGAVYCPLDSTDRPMIIESSLFEGNTAGVSASAVACHDRDLIIRDTQFIDNKGTPILFESSNARGDHQFDVRF